MIPRALHCLLRVSVVALFVVMGGSFGFLTWPGNFCAAAGGAAIGFGVGLLALRGAVGLNGHRV